ncbi:mitochondrial carrier domain-containing protein [Globomyces pollinis-pini]|nr:mitochondrial carrier domain-containing protein [Globomyces pollinis-pini]
MSPVTGNSKDSTTARLLGSGTSGILELLGFHPVDTVAKRLMNNKQKIYGSGITTTQSLGHLNNIIFKDAANKGTFSKYLSLFPGLGAAAGYKILQRMYKFGGQPFVNDYLKNNHKSSFNTLFGEKHSKTIMHATAGSVIGIGEVVLLPLDALKIKFQVSQAEYAGKGVFQIIREEGFSLYRGASWTAARNAPGSFALFGGSAVVKEHLFQLSDYSKATFYQNFIASIAGAITSITVSAPLDVIKTRIQARTAENALGGWVIVKEMVVKEGLGSFFKVILFFTVLKIKGLTPKILVVGPKLIFSFTVAQSLIPLFGNMLDKK